MADRPLQGLGKTIAQLAMERGLTLDPKLQERLVDPFGVRLPIPPRPPATPLVAPEPESKHADEPGEAVGGDQTTDKPKRARKAKSASTLPVIGGKREVKAYPVTEDELENLGVLSIAAAATFSVASFMAAFWLSAKASIALSTGVKPEVSAYWQGVSTFAGVVAVALFLVGAYLVYRGHTKVGNIKSGTAHD